MEGALVDVMNVNGFLDDGQVPGTQLGVSPRDQVPRREDDRSRCLPFIIVTVAASSRIPYRDKVRRRDDTGLLFSIASRAVTS